MDNKVRFGIDYWLAVEELVITSSNDDFNNILLATTIFLNDWGLDASQIGEAFAQYQDSGFPHSSADREAAVNRLVSVLVSRPNNAGRFFSQMVALCHVDENFTDLEKMVVVLWQVRLKLSDEIRGAMVIKGVELGLLLAKFAKSYIV